MITLALLMREVAFIKQNKEKWLRFEQSITGKVIQNNPDELANLYIHLMNDLSYAQTYYPKSKLVTYLNHLASQSYLKIYTTKRTSKNIFVKFFTEDVPLAAYQYRKQLYYALLFFALFAAIGVFSSANNQEFARQILGNHYVDQTLENIKSGDAVAVYKGGSTWGSFIGITFNNLKVGALLFLSGITAGIGTGYIMMENSIMVGVFQYFFHQENAFWESVRGIWIHGSFEIFAMIIECGAGFIIASSMFFPKTLSRKNAFKIGIRDAFKIFLSTIPFTIVAGFLEGYITRLSNVMPHFLSYGIILSSLSFIAYYYLIYPHRVYKRITNHTLS